MVISATGIGNAIMATPLLEALSKSKRGYSIHLLCSRAASSLFEHDDRIDQLIYFDQAREHRFLGTCRLARELRARRFLVAINTFPGAKVRYALLCYLAGIPTRISHRYRFPSTYKNVNFLYTHLLPYEEGIHETLLNSMLLKPLNINIEGRAEYALRIPEHPRDVVKGFLEQQGLDGCSVLIGIHPGAGDSPLGRAKRWNPKCYVDLIARLSEHKDVGIIIIQGPSEAREVRDILSSVPANDKIKVSSGLNLVETAQMLRRLRALITTDSGIGHLAAAMHTPVISLFGPSDYRRTAPLGERNMLIRHQLDCYGCYSVYQPLTCDRNYRCMDEITVSEVYETVQRFL